MLMQQASDRQIHTYVFTGNTVSRDSAVAECFGIKPRKIKRGLNIITNSKGRCKNYCILRAANK